MNINKVRVENFKAELGMKMEQLLDLISDVKIDIRELKTEHVDSMVVPDVRETRKAIGVKSNAKEVLEVIGAYREEKAKTEDAIHEEYKKAIFMLSAFEEEITEVLSGLCTEESEAE